MMHGTINVKVRITLARKGSAAVYFKSIEEIGK